MSDRDLERGERRKDQPDPRGGREPQQHAKPNRQRSTDERGSDSNRSGSESNRS